MKHLPIHKAMLTSLAFGMTVVYNGKTRPDKIGSVGTITGLTDKSITVEWENYPSVNYSHDWFFNNIYLQVPRITVMRPFKGDSYVKKYKKYQKTLSQLKEGDCINHSTMKYEVDNCIKIDEELDTKGDFYVIDDFHNCVMSRHQTQRIAEEKAKHYVDKYCSETYTVVKAVAVAKKKSFIERLFKK